MQGRTQHPPSLLARTTAQLAILLVLALTVLAASPELHERLHGHGVPAATAMGHHGASAGQTAPDADDGGCIVTLFAQGIVIVLSLFALAFTGQVMREADFAAFDRIFPKAPPYLFLPTQAPPLGLS